MGAGLASPGETKRFCGQCFSLVGPQGSPPPPILGPLHTHTLFPCTAGPSVAYVLRTGPAQGLGPPVAQEGAFFSVPFCPSLWQRCFGVFASPSPDLLLRPRNGLITA